MSEIKPALTRLDDEIESLLAEGYQGGNSPIELYRNDILKALGFTRADVKEGAEVVDCLQALAVLAQELKIPGIPWKRVLALAYLQEGRNARIAALLPPEAPEK
jgi:hypothetical protein